MKRLAIPLVLGAATLALLAPSASAKPKFFQTPSGNIGCVIIGAEARCDIRNHQWPTPPTPAGCPLDYGNGVEVGKKGRASYTCAGDTVLSPSSPVLGYGEKITRKRFRCKSKPQGVRCVNRRNKHGFFLSTQNVRLF
jgi:hypothetical protein